MKNFFLVFIGAGVGGSLRYCIQSYVSRFACALPVGTILINLAGSLLIGIMCGMVDAKLVTKNLSLFVIPGILGGFTTFSTFSIETVFLAQKQEYCLALLNILISVCAGIVLAYIGYRSARQLF